MASTSNGNSERGDYKNVALEEEDIVEMKKQLATGSSKDLPQSVSSRECFHSGALAGKQVLNHTLFFTLQLLP